MDFGLKFRIRKCCMCVAKRTAAHDVVINWNNSDLSSIRHAFNSAMCKIYKVKFQLLDSLYDFANQCDSVQDIFLKRRRFELKLLSSNNLVIRHLLAISSVGLS